LEQENKSIREEMAILKFEEPTKEAHKITNSSIFQKVYDW